MAKEDRFHGRGALAEALLSAFGVRPGDVTSLTLSMNPDGSDVIEVTMPMRSYPFTSVRRVFELWPPVPPPAEFVPLDVTIGRLDAVISQLRGFV